MVAQKSPGSFQPLLNIEQAAEFLGLTKKALEHLKRQGEGPPFIYINRSNVRFRPEDIDAWLESKRVDPAAVAS